MCVCVPVHVHTLDRQVYARSWTSALCGTLPNHMLIRLLFGRDKQKTLYIFWMSFLLLEPPLNMTSVWGIWCSMLSNVPPPAVWRNVIQWLKNWGLDSPSSYKFTTNFRAWKHNKNAGAGTVFCRFKRTSKGRGLRLDVLSSLKWHSRWHSYFALLPLTLFWAKM